MSFIALKNSFLKLPQLVKNHWIFFILLFLSTEVPDQLFNHFKAILGPTSLENSHMQILLEANILIFQMFKSAIILISVPVFLHYNSLKPLAALHILWERLNLLGIESVRATASVIRWSTLLIFPGIIKYLKLHMVPFVVLFQDEYESGEVDALDSSSQILRGSLLTLLFSLISFSLLPQVFSAVFGLTNSALLTDQPLQYLLSKLITWMLELLLASFLYFFYIELCRKKEVANLVTTEAFHA